MEASGRSEVPATTPPASQHDVERYQRTLQAARLLQSTLDLKELTAIILEIVRNEVPVDRVTAFVVDAKRQLLHSVVAQGVEAKTITMPISKGIAGFVAAQRQALDIADAYADSRFNPEFDELLLYRTKDIFALPVLNNNGDVVGVLELLNRKAPISPDDVEFLQDISVFIGLALENAWLHEEVRHKAQIEEELARSRERLAQMDRLSLMSEVLSTVASELTSPIAVVQKYASLMKQDPAMSFAMLRYIEIMESAAASSNEAINGFVNFIQKSAGERAMIDIRELVRQTIAVRASHWAFEGILIIEELEPTPPVLGNASELQHALLNVIRNAEDAMTANDQVRRLTIRTMYEHGLKHVRIDIVDNGAGIPTHQYERIFEPFFSTKRERGRTGLGLTIANRIIREHEGEILFETRPGQGTVFTIELPAGPR
jgi:signal transduction histidine kinase